MNTSVSYFLISQTLNLFRKYDILGFKIGLDFHSKFEFLIISYLFDGAIATRVITRVNRRRDRNLRPREKGLNCTNPWGTARRS